MEDFARELGMTIPQEFRDAAWAYSEIVLLMRQCRQETGVTTAELASRMEVSHEQVEDLERLGGSASLEHVLLFFATLGKLELLSSLTKGRR